MIEIFDENEYIETYIKHGFKNVSRWYADMALYTRWKKAEEGSRVPLLTKDMLVKEIEKKCIQSFSWFTIDEHHDIVKNVVNQNWNKEFQPVVIKKINVSFQIIQWFLNQKLKKNELKVLFTIYLGYRIKQEIKSNEKYLAWFVYENDKSFLRNNSNISTNASLFEIIGSLYNKGYLSYGRDNFSQQELQTYLDKGISLVDAIKIKQFEEQGKKFRFFAKFIFNNEEFQSEGYKSDDITLNTKDLYNIGDVINKFTEKYIICKNCHRVVLATKRNKSYCDDCIAEKDQIRKKAETAKYTKIGTKILECIDCGKKFEIDARIMNKVRCDECQLLKDNYIPIGTKIVICVDCGKEFKVSARSRQKEPRCPDCYKIYRNKMKALKEKERRKLKKQSK